MNDGDASAVADQAFGKAGQVGVDAPVGRDARPLLAVISNGFTPYRVHVLRRIVREIPQVRLATLYTHEECNSPWPFQPPEEIGAVVFGKGEQCLKQDRPANAGHEWRKGGYIIEWIKRHGVRAVVIDGYNDPGRMRILWWCKRQGLPCLMFGDSNIHGDVKRGWKAIAKRLVVPPLVRCASGILCCGQYGRAYFTKYGCPPDRIFLFPYEPDYSLIFDLPPEVVEAAKRRYGLREGRRRLVFSGRMVREKRPDLIIEAFLAIALHRPQWDLVMMGDGPLRGSLEARVPSSLADRVTWCGFLTSQRDVTAVYRASDVLVLPSDYEPWALVVNEAVAAGMAIIASSVVGAAVELVREGVNGRIFPPGDLAALVRCLNDVTQPDRVDALKAASARVLADWRRIGDPIAGLRNALRLTGVLSESGTPSGCHA
ncbi:MAG TPA: glycosyltransferase family 4 protein [Tepidisphaeraceae bacterium]|nr:glycosyltransferase family 4 protein [Tepidisphaeraceae bacterium]